jgi:preprotein translocase subunit SecG
MITILLIFIFIVLVAILSILYIYLAKPYDEKKAEEEVNKLRKIWEKEKKI